MSNDEQGVLYNSVPLEVAATITYKGSVTRPDGGWDHCEIIIDGTASQEEIDHAVEVWRNLRAAALPDLLAGAGKSSADIPYRPAAPALPPIEDDVLQSKIGFGKYANETLGWIELNDESYFDWLTTKWQPRNGSESERMVEILRRLFAKPEKPPVSQPRKVAPSQDDTDLPF